MLTTFIDFNSKHTFNHFLRAKGTPHCSTDRTSGCTLDAADCSSFQAKTLTKRVSTCRVKLTDTAAHLSGHLHQLWSSLTEKLFNLLGDGLVHTDTPAGGDIILR